VISRRRLLLRLVPRSLIGSPPPPLSVSTVLWVPASPRPAPPPRLLRFRCAAARSGEHSPAFAPLLVPMWFNVGLECWTVELFPLITEWGFAVPALFRFAVPVPLFCRRVCLGAWAPIVHGVLVRRRCLLHPAALSAPSHLDWIGHWIGRRPSSSSSRASCSASSRLGRGQPSFGTTKLGSGRIDCLNICYFIAHPFHSKTGLL
jgi:hypothetical protein